MKAVFFENGQLKIADRPEPSATAGQVVVKLKAASLNRRDLYTPKRLGDKASAVILGSDGAGIIEALGEGVKNFKIGDEVIINPSLRWYEQSVVPPADFDIVSLPDDGTFAEKIAISVEQIEPKPAYLTFEEAATLGIAPLTGYRALVTKAAIQAGETLFIPGASSGVATFIIQFAKNLGARVIVTSRSADKLAAAKELGADLAINTADDWSLRLQDEVIDTVIDSVGAATFNRSLAVLKKGGKLVTFGATTADVTSFNLRDFFYGQYTLYGTTLGCRVEFRACLAHITTHKMKPVIDRVYPIEQAQQAMERLRKNQQFGKIVITM
ncbi:zinc-binding dehydrogenase [Kurthia sibirica]|uniref:Alcohol dehydrogenase n=1 Tax=Kurthia sibirica TaxID=202750 RepID=A0A2U3ANN7_9BACL|nr:zinc-binding dehydrogenase [Kurthia sibirica]PWI26160.1 alcohol dehydrogenase [Kurthia sibirica]GEK33420.1 putative zinc-type alcohol dehydrogenase-like protein YogA [Kurthia sibirica]